ncbi:MAG: hypothetical protein IJ637_05310 [Prevotella sp.]|nr:hypothetical protein [Prevotella sp.]
MNETQDTISADRWYVMRHLNPQQIDTLLQMDSDGKLRQKSDEPLRPYRFYVPFQYMPIISSRNATDGKAGKEKKYAPEDDVNALRNDLHNFVFIQAPAERVKAIVYSDWNMRGRLRLTYYRNTDHQEVTIPDKEMQQLMETIEERHLQFYIDQPIDSFAPHDRVILQMEPWTGKHGEIKKITVKNGQALMTISLNILGRTKSINFTGIQPGDVTFEDAERGRVLSDNPITNYEEEIIDLLSHRFGNSSSADTAQQDHQRLRRLATYNHIYVEDAEERARFTALKLICAYLLQSSRKDVYLQEVVGMLDGKQTATSDADAYLMTSLFVATRQAMWRTAIKEYRSNHPDSSDTLRRYLSILKDIKTKKPTP